MQIRQSDFNKIFANLDTTKWCELPILFTMKLRQASSDAAILFEYKNYSIKYKNYNNFRNVHFLLSFFAGRRFDSTESSSGQGFLFWHVISEQELSVKFVGKVDKHEELCKHKLPVYSRRDPQPIASVGGYIFIFVVNWW